MTVEIKTLDKRIGKAFPLPMYRSESAAVIDLVACIKETMVIHPNARAELVPTGLSINIKDPGLVAMALPLPEAGHKGGLVLGNLVHLLHSGDDKELMVSIWNRDKDTPIFLQPGDIVGQLVFVPALRPEITLVD